MRFRDLPIKWKFIATIMAVCAVALLVAGTLLFIYEYQTIRDSLKRDLQIIARISASNSTAALSFDDPKAAEDTLSALAAKQDIEAACLYDREGRVFAAYARAAGGKNPPDRPGPDGFESPAGGLALFGPVRLGGERIGTIYVRSDLSILNDWLATFAWVVVVILLVTVVFAFAIASFLQRPFLAPVLGLAETARKVSSEENYAIRAVKHGQDELGILVDRFNKMIERIQIRDQALEQIRMDLEERVEVRTRDLREANRELEAFSYSVAHDLRAPLRTIDGFSQVLQEDCAASLDRSGLDYLERIRKATQRMGRLLDDMLNLSKVTRSSVNPEEIDLCNIARNIAASLREQHPGRDVEFTVSERLPVRADAGLITIALENLLGNAWKFTGKQAQAQVEFGMRLTEGMPVYFVRDNGAGFEMQYAAKLFSVFHRLHKDSDFPGTGVGLATVQRIINRHGGRLWAEAAVGTGATFYFTLGEGGQKA